MKSQSTQDARRDFAALIEDMLRGEHVELTRYGRPVAVMVPHDWYAGTGLKLARRDRDEHWEVAVQADPGGTFFVLADPQERYPDEKAAGEQARKLQDKFHCVRVRHVITDWHMPDEGAATEGQP